MSQFSRWFFLPKKVAIFFTILRFSAKKSNTCNILRGEEKNGKRVCFFFTQTLYFVFLRKNNLLSKNKKFLQFFLIFDENCSSLFFFTQTLYFAFLRNNNWLPKIQKILHFFYFSHDKCSFFFTKISFGLEQPKRVSGEEKCWLKLALIFFWSYGNCIKTFVLWLRLPTSNCLN